MRERARCCTKGQTAENGFQHTTHAPRGLIRDQGGQVGGEIDRYIEQGPCSLRHVTATPTQEQGKQQNAAHALLPALGAVKSGYAGTYPDQSTRDVPPDHIKNPPIAPIGV